MIVLNTPAAVNSMKCPYCHKNVAGYSNVVMILSEGPAHSFCHEQQTLSDRNFKSIHFPNLTLEELHKLKEIVLVELNARSREGYENNGFELFS